MLFKRGSHTIFNAFNAAILQIHVQRKEALLERDWNKSESEKQASLHSLDKSKGKNER
jgi:hypothetical protein